MLKKSSIPSWSLVNSSSLRALGCPGSCSPHLQKRRGEPKQVWLPCAAPGKTGFHVLRQWNSLFAIQINIMSLVTLFMQSVCHRMRLQSHKRQALQNSFLKAAPDPVPSPMRSVNRHTGRDKDNGGCMCLWLEGRGGG